MGERFEEVKIGDTVRVFTYAGTTLRGHAQIPNIVDEDRFIDKIFEPLDETRDGLRFTGVYMGSRMMGASMNMANQKEEPYLRFQVLSQNHPALEGQRYLSPTADDPDLIIPRRLVRRFQILEPTYSSGILPLEEIGGKEAAKVA